MECASLAETAVTLGFDCITVDMEHGHLDFMPGPRHHLRRVALHLDPRRPQRDSWDFHHGPLG